MSLDLVSLLTAQNTKARQNLLPDSNNSSDAGFDRDKFKDLVRTKDEIEKPYKENKNYNDDEESVSISGNKNDNDTDNKGEYVDNFANIGLNNFVNNVISDAVKKPTDQFISNNNISESTSELLLNTFNTIKAAKDLGQTSSQADTGYITNISQNNIQQVSDKITGATNNKLAQNVFTEITGSNSLSQEIINSILQGNNVNTEGGEISEFAKSVLGSFKAQSDLPSLNEVAGKIIQIHQENAKLPEVTSESAKLDNLGNFIKEIKNNKDISGKDKKPSNSQVADKQSATTVQNSNNDKIADKQAISTLQKQLDNVSANLQNVASNNVSNDNAQNPQASPVDQLNKLENQDKKLSIDPKGFDLKTDDFIKFQKFATTSELHNKNLTTNKFGNADDVLAQIKFGVSPLVKGQKNISIQLHPKELGGIDIKMETNNEGKTKVTVIAEKSDTLTLLQKESNLLREILHDALKTNDGSLNLSFHDRNSDAWQQQSDRGFNDFRHSAASQESDDNFNPLANIENAYQSYGFVASSGLDIKV